MKFRNALIDANGFTKSEQLAPIQGTSTSLPVAGNGTQSNNIFGDEFKKQKSETI